VKYLFGDTDAAGRRLKLLAEAFAPTTEAFVRAAAAAPPELLADLGCGPGYATHPLAGGGGRNFRR